MPVNTGIPTNIPPIWGGPPPCDLPGHRHPGFEISTLSSFIGYFNSDSGDWPVTVVANNIEEAAKILRMPGAFKQDSVDPKLIKFEKGNIGVSRPVHRIGFSTTILPDGAIISGACATPRNYTVINGDNVIFTATQPFGWKFMGWYRGFSTQPQDTWTLISNDLVTEINVYDPYATLLEYIAFYEFDPSLKNGRYIDITRGTLMDMRFTPYSSFAGQITYSPDTANVYNWVISVLDDASKSITCIPDPAIVQPDQIPVTFTYDYSPVGLNLVVQSIAVTNPMGWATSSVINLRWLQPQGPGYI